MAIMETIDFFKGSVKHSIMGDALPYYTIKDIAKSIKKDNANIRKVVKLLIDRGVIVEHPFNTMIKEKRYRLNREQLTKI